MTPSHVFDKKPGERRASAERGRKAARTKMMLQTAARRGVIKGMLNTPTRADVTLPKLKFMED